jgi:four helix bundle protein
MKEGSEFRKPPDYLQSERALSPGRRGAKEKARFYTISTGSTEELKYFLILSRDLGTLKDIESL